MTPARPYPAAPTTEDGPAPSATASPSTPPVPLAALLARTDLGLRQIAGPREGVAIHWVHTSEMADPVPYLLGGELLLTAGVHMGGGAGETHLPGGGAGEVGRAMPSPAASGGVPSGASSASYLASPSPPSSPFPASPESPAPSASSASSLDAYLDGYAARTVAAGAAALGFGIAPVHDAVPRALVAACDRHGLPLIEVPAGTPFTAVESAVWQAVTEARHRELTRLSEAQRALAAAATRPDPAPAVLRALARHVHGWAALLAPDGSEHASAGPRPAASGLAAAARLAAVVRPGGPSSATDTLPATDPYVPPETVPEVTPETVPGIDGDTAGETPYGTGRAPTTTAATSPNCRTSNPNPSPSPSTSPSTHLTAYALTSRTPDRPDSPEGRDNGHALALVVAAAPHTPAAHTIAGTAAVLLSLITGPSAHRAPIATAHSAALAQLLLGAPPADVGPLLGAPLWTVVHAEPRRGTPGSPAALAAALGTLLAAPAPASPGTAPALRALVPIDQEVTAQPGWTLGVSAPATVAELPTADRHAASALRRAAARRIPLVRHRTPSPHGITALVSPTDAQQHARALLAPLTDSPPLLTTLHNWLSQHGNWETTATTLGIHRNTVRQRITRIAGLLGTDLDDPDVRMELWFALRALDRATPPA
ncbi:helix-turn-helix domain-containing protein [Streptomyces pinistramenti]|uniref:helix-turn-helix domain-containing protein n=1 Tax=Streptomyces pinistramenti TaxID=2884812 RepID=UPI001D091E3E|nr:PucR family transcriptional regulator [Streptomyces pinistramenti]MCB5911992.1 PucR family transcriptional regulator [Streptomyces pinistramenti]